MLLAGAVAAIALALDLDVAATWERARGLAGHAQARLCRIPGVELVSPQQDATRTGLVCFRAGDVESAHLTAYLEHVGGVVARTVGARGDRPGVVRLSLHAYTTEAEVERAADCVERALREGVPSEIAAEAARERDAARWI